VATTEDVAIDRIKVLAAAVSTQAQASNRAWLGLLSVAVLTLLPRVPNTGQPCEPVLPLGLGPVDRAWYYPILFMILVVLTVAVSVAQAQLVRAMKLAHSFLKSLAGESPTVLGMHPRELYDIMRLPSLNRVAPLAQFVLGAHQFHATASSRSRLVKLRSEIAYAALRLVSMTVYYTLPTAAIWRAFSEMQVQRYVWFLSLGGGLIAMSALVVVFLSDLQYSAEVMGIIRSGGAPVQGPSTQTP
jgi:hypothetical protein